MENRRIQLLCLTIFIISNFVIPSTLWSAESKSSEGSVAKNKNLDKELLKKYGSYRPKEVLNFKDSMASGERVDLDNEYFKISYPKCFKVEPTVEDSKDVTIKNSASIDFNRSKECKEHKSDEDFNRMQLFFDSNYVDPKRIEARERASKMSYRQQINVNGSDGVVYWGAGASHEWNHQGEPVAGWVIVVGCEGKKNELFKFSFLGQRNSDVVTVLESKKFDLPEDYKQIISSFHCRKNR